MIEPSTKQEVVRLQYMDVQSIDTVIVDEPSVPVDARALTRQSLNLCSGCNRNFAGVRAHEIHRVGKFGVDRHCMTPDEMVAKGFTMGIEPVRRFREGVDYTETMETWHEPVSAKQQAGLDRMKKGKAANE